MSAKKKAKTTRGARAAAVIDRWAAMELELDRLRKLVFSTEDDLMHMEKRLIEANALLEKGTETIREHAAVVVELNEKLAEKIHSNTELAARNVQLAQQLAAKERELEGADREMAGVAGTIDFLWEEIDRYRNSLMDHIRWDAMLPEDLLEAVGKVRMQAYEYEHEDAKP